MAEKASIPGGPPSDHTPSDNTDHALSDDAGRTTVEEEKETDIDGNNATQVPETSPRAIHGWKWAISYTALLSSIFLYAFDCTVVADVQTDIINDFGAIDQLSWLSNGLVLPATAMVMPWGRLYGQFNAKTLYLVCVLIFEVGSAVCGAAPTVNALIVGRALAGVGGSGIYMGVMTLMAATTTMEERPFYIGLTGITWGLGIVLGPIIGGAFAISSVGWRWAFYINLLVAVPAVPSYIFLLPNHVDPRPGVSLKARWVEMDYLGNLFLVGAIVTFILAINWGGVIYPWNSGQVIGCFVASGVLFIILGIQQVRLIGTTLDRRILPVQIFNNPTILLLFACCAAGGSSAFVPIYFVPTFFQFTRSDSPLEAGVRLLPFIVVMVVIITANGHLMGKFGYYQPWILTGGLLAMTGSALMYTVQADTSESRIYGYTVIIGAGVGMWLQVPFSVAQAFVAPEDIPAAVGLVMLGQFVGITISLAIANTVFLNDAERSITALLPGVSSETIEDAIQGATSGFLATLDENLRAQVLDAIVAAMNKAYILVITAGSLAAVLSLLLPRKKLFGAAAAAPA
ncbi:MFS multidrug transporter-like protein [Xylariomycetidae sp. FL2044]|nr:MFS multidrug transporter-like protein [Xylariomycetidae sp. FL2044]